MSASVPGVDVGMVLVAHGVGDYIIQSDWMAQTKTRRGGIGWWAAVLHGVTYALPFLFLTRDPVALGIIVGTHILIDHWRLARYLIWISNWAAPTKFRRGRGHWEPRFVIEGHNPPWAKCRRTGFPDRTPEWLSTWLMFIVDNLLHIVINIAVLWWSVATR